MIVTGINSVIQLELNFTVAMEIFKIRLSQSIHSNNDIFARLHFAIIQNLWAQFTVSICLNSNISIVKIEGIL